MILLGSFHFMVAPELIAQGFFYKILDFCEIMIIFVLTFIDLLSKVCSDVGSIPTTSTL